MADREFFTGAESLVADAFESDEDSPTAFDDTEYVDDRRPISTSFFGDDDEELDDEDETDQTRGAAGAGAATSARFRTPSTTPSRKRSLPAAPS
jgi:hypothetical protein